MRDRGDQAVHDHPFRLAPLDEVESSRELRPVSSLRGPDAEDDSTASDAADRERTSRCALGPTPELLEHLAGRMVALAGVLALAFSRGVRRTASLRGRPRPAELRATSPGVGP